MAERIQRVVQIVELVRENRMLDRVELLDDVALLDGGLFRHQRLAVKVRQAELLLENLVVLLELVLRGRHRALERVDIAEIDQRTRGNRDDDRERADEFGA